MNIAIIGLGKMGHIVKEIALSRGHRIVAEIDADNLRDFDSRGFAAADVAIEFTTPTAALDNFRRCWVREVPVVSGTTGWGTPAAMAEVREACAKGATLLHASNFSIGVNITAAVNRYLTSLIERFDAYTPTIHEVHHIHKLDHPSGTAITLADGIVESSERFNSWVEPTAGLEAGKRIIISHERRDEVPGIHTVTWDSDIDRITLTHEAKSRRGFGMGAVLAAEWLVAQPKGKFYKMSDMLGF